MMKIFTLLLIAVITVGWDYRDFPTSMEISSSLTYMICISESTENKVVQTKVFYDSICQEYNCDGSIKAVGKVIKRNSTEGFLRQGHWITFYNFDKNIKRSEGEYSNNIREGLWVLFDTLQNVEFEIVFYRGDILKEISYIDDKKGDVIRSTEKVNILVKEYRIWILLIGLIPIAALRIGSNISTYNVVYDENFIPGIQNYQKGGYMVNLMCTIIFWWIYRSDDTIEMKNSKKRSNWISIISIILFIISISILTIYDV